MLQVPQPAVKRRAQVQEQGVDSKWMNLMIRSSLRLENVCCRYRSQLCNDGPKCRRKVCFFAHTIDELRVPPSKPFVAPDTLVGSPEADATSSQVRQHASLIVRVLAIGYWLTT